MNAASSSLFVLVSPPKGVATKEQSHTPWAAHCQYTRTPVSHLHRAKSKPVTAGGRLCTAAPFSTALPLYKTVFNRYELRYCQPARHNVNNPYGNLLHIKEEGEAKILQYD